MNYVLLLLLVILFIYRQYNKMLNNIEPFADKGLIIRVPQEGNYTLLSDVKHNPIYFLGAILEQFGKDLKNKKSMGVEHNIKQIEDKKADFALCNEKIFIDKVLGNNNLTKNNKLEFVMAFFHEHIYIISKSIDSFSIDNFENKNIWIGSTKNSAFYYLRLFANILGMGLKEWEPNGENNESRVIYFSQGLLIDALLDIKSETATIDYLLVLSGPKLRFLMQLNTIESEQTFFIKEFTNEYFESVMGSLMGKELINVNIYSDPTMDYKKLYGTRIVMFTHRDTDKEYVYNFVRNIADHLGFLTESMLNWTEKTFDDDLQDYAYHYNFKLPEMLSCPPNIKIHDGTRKYMKEIGLITKKPNQICEFNYQKNKCEGINPRPFSKKPLWKLKEVPFPF